MKDEKSLKPGSRASSNWLTLLGGCALSITLICSLVLAVLLLASTVFNVYLAWSLSGYEVSVSRPTSAPSALVLVTPSGVLAIIPTPTAAPTSTPLLTPTAAPTSTSMLIPTQAPTRLPVLNPTRTTPEPETATPTAAASQGGDAEQGGAGIEAAGTLAGSPAAVSVGTSQTSGTPTSEAITYVVQQGDTLWRIADRAYGAGRLWQVIFEENRDILDDPDQIQPGQVLRIPLNP